MSAYGTRAEILQVMDRQHVSFRQLARQLIITDGCLAAMLGGRLPLTISQIEAIAAVLRVPADQLVNTGRYECGKCGGVGSAPTHRMSCPDKTSSAAGFGPPRPAAGDPALEFMRRAS
jgi:hypothetical protein